MHNSSFSDYEQNIYKYLQIIFGIWICKHNCWVHSLSIEISSFPVAAAREENSPSRKAVRALQFWIQAISSWRPWPEIVQMPVTAPWWSMTALICYAFSSLLRLLCRRRPPSAAALSQSQSKAAGRRPRCSCHGSRRRAPPVSQVPSKSKAPPVPFGPPATASHSLRLSTGSSLDLLRAVQVSSEHWLFFYLTEGIQS